MFYLNGTLALNVGRNMDNFSLKPGHVSPVYAKSGLSLV